MNQTRNALVTYGVPVLGICLVTLIKLSLPATLGADVPFLLYGLVIIVSGSIAGVGSALLAVTGSVFASWYFFLPSYYSFRLLTLSSAVQLAVFAADGLLVTALISSLKRARRSADRSALDYQGSLGREVETRQRLQSLSELTATLSTLLTSPDIVDLVVKRGTELANADTCTLYAVDEADGSLVLLGVCGVAQDLLDRIQRIDGKVANPTFDALRTEQALWVESEAEYRALFPALASLPSSRAKAFWSVPLIVEGRAYGLLAMGYHEARRFPAEERASITILGLHCAQAIRRAQLFEREKISRERAERAQASLETTLRSIGDAVITTDADANVVFMNPVAEKLTGFTELEAKGRSLERVFHIVNEETRLVVENPALRVFREGSVVGLANHTVLLGGKPGQETAIDDSAAPIRGSDQQILGAVLVFRDVTVQKKAEARRAFLASALEALTASLDYRTILSRVAELAVPRLADWCSIDVVEEGSTELKRLAIRHVDADKRRLAFELAEKYPPKPETSRGAYQVLRSGKSELYEDIPVELITRSAQSEEHLRMLRQLGLRSALLVPIIIGSRVFGVLTLVYAESGRRYSADDQAFAEDFAVRIATAIENARLYQLEQDSRAAADAASRAKDEFLAMVSHELRTPLSAVLGWARLINAGRLDAEKMPRAFAAIERNATSMARLIEDLLDVSRIVSGRMKLELSPLSVVNVVEAALESARPNAEAKQIRIDKAFEPNVGLVLGDAARIQQVVWNLFSNAVKFTANGGSVRVTVRSAGLFVEIEVSDTGRGIDPKFMPHLFSPFRQANGGITRVHGGLGIGLSITRHLIELHHGGIEARSGGEGLGATFVVKLPLMEQADLHARPRIIQDASENISFDRAMLSGLRILVVDDDPDSRQLMRSILEDCGCRVWLADGVAAALSIIERELPELLVSDIGMPGEDGYELIRKVRALPVPAARDVPAIAVTAYARSEDRFKALRAGYLMHVPKPIEPAELLAAITNLVRRSSPDTVR